MIFKEENGRYFAELRNGGVIEFESAEEMAAVECEYNEIQTLFGREVSSSTAKAVSLPRDEGRRKKVRITIDTDVEYLGNKKALA